MCVNVWRCAGERETRSERGGRGKGGRERWEGGSEDGRAGDSVFVRSLAGVYGVREAGRQVVCAGREARTHNTNACTQHACMR